MTPQQVHATRSAERANATTDADIDQAVADAADRSAADRLVEHSDELLDEIDGCLEENVLEILRTFVNKGGQ